MAEALNRYRFPLPKEAVSRVTTDSPAHVGRLRYAVDLIAPEGTPVLAAADGTVTFVRDDSGRGGPTVAYWNDTNFIVIAHANNEFTRYDHLAKWSSEVVAGQPVRAGEQIARVGMTGFTLLAHLHFQVFVFTGINVWTDFQTLELPSFVA